MTSGNGTVTAASVAMSPSRAWTVTRGRAAAAAICLDMGDGEAGSPGTSIGFWWARD